VDVTPEKVRKLLDAATPGSWKVNGGHPNELEEGCRCLGCHVPWTIWYTTNTLFCDEQPDNECREKNCQQEGYSWDDANLIAAAPDIARAYLELIDHIDFCLDKWQHGAPAALAEYARTRFDEEPDATAL